MGQAERSRDEYDSISDTSCMRAPVPAERSFHAYESELCLAHVPLGGDARGRYLKLSDCYMLTVPQNPGFLHLGP